MKILAISPHADDVELGAGGYLHRQASRGDEVVVYVLSASPYKAVHTGKTVTVNEREFEGFKAAEQLQIDKYFFLDHGLIENEFDKASMGGIVALLQALISSEMPDVLLIPLPSFNKDHQVTYDACITALRPHAMLRRPAQVMAYENPGQHWGPTPPSSGHVYVDLDARSMDAKLSALRCHRSQAVSTIEGPFGLDGTMILAEKRAVECGAEYAEMFYLLYGKI